MGKTEIGVALLLAALIAAIICYEVAHPCTRYAPATCYTTTCLVHAEGGGCVSSITQPYACEQCVERK